MEKLANQLTAAVAMSAAALIASGYAITWARLDRVKAPPRAVLPALSTGYYLGVALEALLFLLLFLLTVGLVFLLAQIRPRWRKGQKGPPAHEGPREEWPKTSAWLGLGVVVAASGVIYGGAPTSGVFSSGVEAVYPLVVAALAILVVGLSLAIGRASRMLKLKGPIPLSAAVLVLCTAAAVGFKVVDARFGAIAFPQGAALTPEANCHTPDAQQVPKGCGFGGFYVGEDSNWIYFVQTPLVCPGMPNEPGRLLQVRRDEPFDVIVSEHLPTKPLKCSASVVQDANIEPEAEEPGTKESSQRDDSKKTNGAQDGRDGAGKGAAGGNRDGTSGKSPQGGDQSGKGSQGGMGGEDPGHQDEENRGQGNVKHNPLPMPERD